MEGNEMTTNSPGVDALLAMSRVHLNEIANLAELIVQLRIRIEQDAKTIAELKDAAPIL